MKQIDDIRRFEEALDSALSGLGSPASMGPAALKLGLDVLDYTYEAEPGMASWLRHGLSILAPRLLLSQGTQQPDLEKLVRDLDFASHYYNLRELLYYMYNAPGAVSWEFEGERVRIRLADPSIPRQFFLVANRWLLDSLELAALVDSLDTAGLLADVKLLKNTLVPEALSNAVMEEVSYKLQSYYDLLPAGTAVSVGDYTYDQFLAVYKQLLANALLHRYEGQLRGRSGAVQFERQSFLPVLSGVTGVPVEQCRAIIQEITYDAAAARDAIEASYFSLFDIGNGMIAYSPSDLLVDEGIVSALRLVALRRPSLFLQNVSGPLGDSLTRRVASAFRTQGFQVHTNLQLPDPSLPDVDVLVISEERTLGYRVYICETKNPLPPKWAKDHLRVLAKDGVLKAFDQLDKIMAFLASDSGARFLRQLLPTQGLPDFGGEFLIAASAMVVTSHNAGMFFAEKGRPVLDYKNLEYLLGLCDGDVTYFDWAMQKMLVLGDDHAVVSPVEVAVGEYVARYDGVSIDGCVEFQQHSYKSEGLDTEIAENFVADGHHPFDVLLDGKSG